MRHRWWDLQHPFVNKIMCHKDLQDPCGPLNTYLLNYFDLFIFLNCFSIYFLGKVYVNPDECPPKKKKKKGYKRKEV